MIRPKFIQTSNYSNSLPLPLKNRLDSGKPAIANI
jgi:hypothetical protein